jgi:transmembrane sensor
MFLKNKTDWSLLAKSLAGETDEKENQAIHKWLDLSPENRALYMDIKSDWKMMDKMKTQFNVDNAWNKLQSRIIAHDEAEITTDYPVRKIQPFRYFLTPVRIAASVMLIALLGVSVIFFAERMQKVDVTTAVNERGKKVLLPDGSAVYLNGNSSIQYAKHFTKRSREVKLAGEAFFEVTPDKSRPFMIQADNACIKVVGTSFNVDATGIDNQVEVYVSTGIVELSDADNANNKVLLQPGNIGMLRRNIVTSRKAFNENSIAWKTGDVDFSGLMLSEAIGLLNEIYNVTITCREKDIDTIVIDEGKHFHNESLDDILNVICRQNSLKVEKSDNMIYLSGQ